MGEHNSTREPTQHAYHTDRTDRPDRAQQAQQATKGASTRKETVGNRMVHSYRLSHSLLSAFDLPLHTLPIDVCISVPPSGLLPREGTPTTLRSTHHAIHVWLWVQRCWLL